LNLVNFIFDYNQGRVRSALLATLKLGLKDVTSRNKRFKFLPPVRQIFQANLEPAGLTHSPLVFIEDYCQYRLGEDYLHF